MAPPLTTLLGRARAAAPTALVLAALAGLAWWGYATDWAVPRFGGPAAAAGGGAEGAVQVLRPEGAAPAGPCAAFAGVRVRFPSASAVGQAGVRMQAAVERPLDVTVTANGVLDYDQDRLAHLAPRVPGNAWRVERRVGDRVRRGDLLGVVEAPDVGKAKADYLLQAGLVQLRGKILENLSPDVVPVRTVQEARAALDEARIRLANAQQALVNLGLPPPSAEEAARLSPEKLAARVRFLGLPESLARTLDP